MGRQQGPSCHHILVAVAADLQYSMPVLPVDAAHAGLLVLSRRARLSEGEMAQDAYLLTLLWSGCTRILALQPAPGPTCHAWHILLPTGSFLKLSSQIRGWLGVRCRMLESVGSQFREGLGPVLRSYLAPLDRASRPRYSALKAHMLRLQMQVGAGMLGAPALRRMPCCPCLHVSHCSSRMACLAVEIRTVKLAAQHGLPLHFIPPQLLGRCGWRVVLHGDSEEVLAAQRELEANPAFNRTCAMITQWAEDGWVPPQLGSLWRSSGEAQRDESAQRALAPHNR